MQYEIMGEQRMLREMVRRLAKNKIAPGAMKRDEAGVFDWAMPDLMRENGLCGALPSPGLCELARARRVGEAAIKTVPHAIHARQPRLAPLT